MATEITSSGIDAILSRLPSLASQTSHSEIYNINISEIENPAVKLIAAKYLKANDNDVEATLKAIEDTLKWRKEFNPRKAAYEETFDVKFDGIGYNTVLGDDIVVWNIYGKSLCYLVSWLLPGYTILLTHVFWFLWRFVW